MCLNLKQNTMAWPGNLFEWTKDLNWKLFKIFDSLWCLRFLNKRNNIFAMLRFDNKWKENNKLALTLCIAMCLMIHFTITTFSGNVYFSFACLALSLNPNQFIENSHSSFFNQVSCAWLNWKLKFIHQLFILKHIF